MRPPFMKTITASLLMACTFTATLNATPYGVRNASLWYVCMETQSGEKVPCLPPESSVEHYRGFYKSDLPITVWVGCSVPKNSNTFKTSDCLKIVDKEDFQGTPGNGIIVWGGLVKGEYWVSYD